MAEGSLVQILHGQLVIGHSGGFRDFFQSHFDVVSHIGGNGNFLGLALVGALIGLVFQNVYNALEISAVANGQHNRHNGAAELFAQRLLHLMEVRVLAIHLVDDEHLGHMILGRQFPGFFSADGDAAHSADDDTGSFHDAQGTHGLADEVKVAGNVDDVDHLLLPLDGSGSSADGNTALDFFRVKVGDGISVFYAALTVDSLRSEEQRLGQSGLALAAMPHEGDVPDVLGLIVSHYGSPLV